MELKHIEYVAELHAYKQPPLAHQLPPRPTLRDLRARMHDIERRVVHAPASVSAEEYTQLHAWRRVRRQQGRDHAIAGDVPAPGRSRQPTLQVTEPVRRYPHNIQAGRLVRPDPTRRF